MSNQTHAPEDCPVGTRFERGGCPNCTPRPWYATPAFEHYYAPGIRTGDALAPCTVCGDRPSAPRFAARHETAGRPVNLRCRAQRSAIAHRFERVQCPNRATGEARLAGPDRPAYPVCGRHASARTATLYAGRDWRRAIVTGAR